MRNVSRSALVPYRARDMFALVDDVASYPEFLPWCDAADELERSDDVVEARLALRKGAVSKSFTTRNTRREHDSIDLALVDGPFRHLCGGWRFKDLGDDGCKVSLELEFEFSSPVVDKMFGNFFEQTCNALVDAFAKRAAAVYGS